MKTEKDGQFPATWLNRHDRKVIDKYTKFYTNFIESNTAKTDILEDNRYKGNEER